MNFTLGSAGIERRSIPSVATLAPIGDQRSNVICSQYAAHSVPYVTQGSASYCEPGFMVEDIHVLGTLGLVEIIEGYCVK